MSFNAVYENDEVWVSVDGIHSASTTMNLDKRAAYIAALVNLPKSAVLDEEILGIGEQDADIYIFKCYNFYADISSHRTDLEIIEDIESERHQSNTVTSLYHQIREAFKASSKGMLQTSVAELTGCVIDCSPSESNIEILINIIPIDLRYVALEFEITLKDVFEGDQWEEFIDSAVNKSITVDHPFIKTVETETDCFVEFQLYNEKTRSIFQNSLILTSAIEADHRKNLYPVFNEWFKEIGRNLLDYVDAKMLAK